MVWKVEKESGKIQRVVIVRSNPAHTDSRVMKEARTLSQKYRVIILGWDRERQNNRSEEISNNILLKRFPLKAPYGSYAIILYYPIFWLWVIINLLLTKPDVVHACDLDTLIPAKIYGVLKRSQTVFDNFDKFAMAFIPSKKRILYNLIDWFEDILAYKSNLLILVSSDRLRTFRWLPENTILVLNCPEEFPDRTQQKTIEESENNSDVVLVYAGVLSDDRGLLLMEQAISNIEGIKLQVAGRPISKRVLDKLQRNPKVEYLGVLPPEKAIELQGRADAIPLLYDPEISINRVASPNKLFEAMMLGIPVISNVCKNIVEQFECGLVVDYEISSFKEAILSVIRSPELMKDMGRNGRKAFVQYYNWELMESRLHEAYDLLLKSKE